MRPVSSGSCYCEQVEKPLQKSTEKRYLVEGMEPAPLLHTELHEQASTQDSSPWIWYRSFSLWPIGRGKAMLKQPVNSGRSLGGFSGSSLMHDSNSLWISLCEVSEGWGHQSMGMMPHQVKMCFLHPNGTPWPSSSSLEQHVDQYENKTLQEYCDFFFHDYFDSSSQIHSKPFWDEQKKYFLWSFVQFHVLQVWIQLQARHLTLRRQSSCPNGGVYLHFRGCVFHVICICRWVSTHLPLQMV